MGTFLEVYGLVPAAAGESVEYYVDGGVTLAVTADLQLDVRVGAGLNEEADDHFAGGGIAVRR